MAHVMGRIGQTGIFVALLALLNPSLGWSGPAEDARRPADGRQGFFRRCPALLGDLLHCDADFGVFLERQRLGRLEHTVFVDRFDGQGHDLGSSGEDERRLAVVYRRGR